MFHAHYCHDCRMQSPAIDAIDGEPGLASRTKQGAEKEEQLPCPSGPVPKQDEAWL